jgi:hypothetical protein
VVEIESLKRWRLILGPSAEETLNKFSAGNAGLSREQSIMDQALSAIYDDTGMEKASGKGAGSGKSSPVIAKWLADIRTYFSEDVVSVIQSDAIERKGLTQLLFEPELLKSVKPDIEMVKTLMALKGKIPERTKNIAREMVKQAVDEIIKRLENDIRRAVTGAINRREHSPIPNVASIDWKYTIRKNLKNYSPEYKQIIPDRIFFFERTRRAHNWHIILDMDQSGSMAESIIYGSITGSIFASLPALKTRVVAFDTEVVDLTEKCGNDPVEMLFGVQLGGGTDINKSVTYCRQFISEPARTLFFLISDLYEGGNSGALVRQLKEMHEAKVKVISLLALSDKGTPAYDDEQARKIAALGIPCFACTPDHLPELLEGALKGQDLMALSRTLSSKSKK